MWKNQYRQLGGWAEKEPQVVIGQTDPSVILVSQHTVEFSSDKASSELYQ